MSAPETRPSRPPMSRGRLVPLDRDVPGAVITVSTRCSLGEAEDRSGPRAVAILAEHRIVCPPPLVVPDDVAAIRAAIAEEIAAGARLVVTTGGTGVTPGDVTPEACEPLIDQRCHAIETQVLLRGLDNTPLAALSRGYVGITHEGNARGVVIANAPGSRGGVADTLAVLAPLFPHLLEQLDNSDH
ncbi:MogA/MoaB family molybdenum cofactor biosynthesis protein [Nanchangia anserum]|uniref:MogA/MoaB family molybdenum cofactor biosynthesis protein n=1 Tax=Nanchangia anserum TaxID=2692125 RepID=A0A8I0KN96_9ACTO|nr:molybdopterin-binding protein [Nanchangia anserum]MBD3689046.1 MogA/MoaB family molybdenum cofactor biosynthesis protein [Nanchangia anserum]QOX81290.1 MogA/MoaB family molybdenum cofactor biosynthesis protein [Nanchangia anserum]